jgi:type II secretory pathway pseudopilin PulG
MKKRRRRAVKNIRELEEEQKLLRLSIGPSKSPLNGERRRGPMNLSTIGPRSPRRFRKHIENSSAREFCSAEAFLKRSPAFSLMEILVVVMLLGLLALFAVPAFRMARDKTRKMMIVNNLKQIWNGAQIYFVEHGVETVKIDDYIWYIGPDGTPINDADESYTSTIRCILGENYGQVLSIPRSTAPNIEAVFADWVGISVPEDGSTATDNGDPPLPLGIVSSDAAILAVPYETEVGQTEWIGLDLESGKVFWTTQELKRHSDAFWKMIAPLEYCIEKDWFNAWRFFDVDIWDEMYSQFIGTDTSGMKRGWGGLVGPSQTLVGHIDHTGGSYHKGILNTLFDSINEKAAIAAGLEAEYESLKQYLADVTREQTERWRKALPTTETSTGWINPASGWIHNINTPKDDYILAYGLREQIYALGVKIYGMSFISAAYLNEIYVPVAESLKRE